MTSPIEASRSIGAFAARSKSNNAFVRIPWRTRGSSYATWSVPEAASRILPSPTNTSSAVPGSRGIGLSSSTFAGAAPLKQQSRMQKTALAFVDLKSSASSSMLIEDAVSAERVVSNAAKRWSCEPCPENEKITTSSGVAAPKVSCSALRIFAAVAAPSIKSVGLLPGKLSANKACKATASLVLPTKSRTSGSAYFPTPTKVERKAIWLQMVHAIAEKSKNSAQQRWVQRWVQNSQARRSGAAPRDIWICTDNSEKSGCRKMIALH